MTLKYKGFESLDFHIKSNVTRKSFIIAKQCSFWYKLPKRRVIASRSLNILFLNQMKVPFHASEQEFKQMLERGTNHPVTWKHFTGLKIRKSHGPPAILHWAFLLQTDGCFWIFLGQEHLHKKCIYSCFLLKMTMQKFKMKWIILELCRRHRKILPLPLKHMNPECSIQSRLLGCFLGYCQRPTDSASGSWRSYSPVHCGQSSHISGARKERGCCLKALFITQRKSWMTQRPWEAMFRLE